jgi:hypothetical protein
MAPFPFYPLRTSVFTASLLGIAFLIFAKPGLAQHVGSQEDDRAELLRNQTETPFAPGVSPNGVDDGHAAASPNDADLGVQEILKRAEQYQPFTASVGAPFFYTSNIALARSGEVSDFLVAPGAGFYYEPRITRTFYGLLDVRQQFFYYDRFNSFDFGSFDVEAGFNYYLPQFHNLILRGRYDFNRLTFSDRVLDELFSNHSLIASAELPFRFGRAQQLSLGADVDVSVAADLRGPRRNDYDVYLGYSVHLSRWFSLDSAGRVVVRDYTAGGRTDVSEILAVSATYRLTTWWTMSATSSFAANRSNHSAFDYNVANVGGIISLSVKF